MKRLWRTPHYGAGVKPSQTMGFVRSSLTPAANSVKDIRCRDRSRFSAGDRIGGITRRQGLVDGGRQGHPASLLAGLIARRAIFIGSGKVPALDVAFAMSALLGAVKQLPPQKRRPPQATVLVVHQKNRDGSQQSPHGR